MSLSNPTIYSTEDVGQQLVALALAIDSLSNSLATDNTLSLVKDAIQGLTTVVETISISNGGTTGNSASVNLTGDQEISGTKKFLENLFAKSKLAVGTDAIPNAAAQITGGLVVTSNGAAAPDPGAGNIGVVGYVETIGGAFYGPPATGIRSLGTKFLLYPNLTSTDVDHAWGIDIGTQWFSVPNSANQYKWYVGTIPVATLKGTGDFKVHGSGTFASLNVSALNTAPASANSYGTVGEIRITPDFIYVCTASNTWARTSLNSW